LSFMYPGGFVITLPCDREAALAALDAAIASAKRSLLLTTVTVVLFGFIMFAMVASVGPLFETGVFGFAVLLFLVVFLLIPVLAYLQATPWIRYLEELRRGIESGEIDVRDVCGQPIYWRSPRRT
jgi:hypothetical protein